MFFCLEDEEMRNVAKIKLLKIQKNYFRLLFEVLITCIHKGFLYTCIYSTRIGEN